MSIENQLISRIDELETDKSNENDSNDLSNRAQVKISSERARLEEMISSMNLDQTHAISLRESFENDLEKIFGDTQNKLVDLHKIIEDDIGNKSTMEEINIILGQYPDATHESIAELLSLDYDIPLDEIIQYKKIKKDATFSEALEYYSSYIPLVKTIESTFPEIHRDEIEDIVDAYDFLSIIDINRELKGRTFKEFQTWAEGIKNEKRYWNSLSFSHIFPQVSQEDMFVFLDKYPELDMGGIRDVIEGTSFDDFQKDMDIFSEIIQADKKPESLFKDPAIGYFQEIISKKYLQNESYENILLVARNIFMKGIEIGDINLNLCKEERENLDEEYEKHKNTSLFAGRNIVFSAHEENINNDVLKEHDQHGDVERFGKKATIDAIREQGGDLPEGKIFHPENTIESLNNAKQQTLEAIENTPPPLTFIFDGHGAADGLYFSDGEYVDGNTEGVNKQVESVFISPEELATSLKTRYDLGNMTQRDIIIIDACSSQSFIRNVYSSLELEFAIDDVYSGNTSEVLLPIMIGPSEFDQVSYSNWDSDFGSDFLGKVIGLEESKQGKISTIGDIVTNSSMSDNSNPSLFIPSSGKRNVRQIAQHEYENNNSFV